MGKSNRQDTRSERSERELIQKLKAINRAQAKEIAQLRKELGKREDVSADYQDLIQEVESNKNLKPVRATPTCPRCGHEVRVAELGKFNLKTCTACTFRARERA